MDTQETFTMNYFETSAANLVALFGNRKLHIFALNEDVANKELNIHLFVITPGQLGKSEHHYSRIKQSYAQSFKWLSKTPEASFGVYKPEAFSLLFHLDFGHAPLIVHHLCSKNTIVGGVCYAEPDKYTGECKFVTAVLDVLSIQLFQRQQRIEMEDKIEIFQQVINLIPQRVFWKNRKSIYLGANEAFANDAGLKTAELLIGRDDYSTFPLEANEYRQDDAKTIHSRQHLINHEEPQTTQAGEKIWLRTSKRPMINSQNEVIGVLGTYEEITELKRIQFELQEARDKLEQRVKERTQDLKNSNQKLEQALIELKQAQTHLVESEKMAALGRLVASISHEINTPIGVAVTTASYLHEKIEHIEKEFSSKQLTEEDFAHFCSTAQNSTQMLLSNLARASNLIKNAKQIAVDQSNDVPRKIKLNQYVKSILATLRPIFRNRNIGLEVDIDPDLQLIIYPGAFAQVVTNFTENVIKHAFPKNDARGKFRISCYLSGSDIHLHFADNGVGVPLHLQKKIFEPFFTTKRKSGGSGLGLSIIYNIICQQFGGKIECKSKLAQGTEFFISIPQQTNMYSK
ncbi:MAG: PAS domain-containing protein [Paraglaciecola sp.]|nr:PAS domain-containing protein [Paraglaciecola sp.]